MNDVVVRDHAEVAVARLGGVHEERGRAGAREGGGDLARDVPGLADAAHDHAAAAGKDQAQRFEEPLVERAISARTASASISSTSRASRSASL